MIGQTTGLQRRDGLYAWRVMSHNIDVTAIPEYLPERSSPEQNFYAFGYRIAITNLGHEPVQLLRRHWIITDGSGHVEVVEGDGVVGEQPWIEPGSTFEYESSCPLRTPTGNMRGWYYFTSISKVKFRSRIPLFFLRPNSLRH